MKTKLVNKDIRSDYVRELLRGRGVQDPEVILCPQCGLQNPFDLENMEEAVEELSRVLNEIEQPRIGLIVDSDCDGFTSSAIIFNYLKRIAPQCEIKYYLHEGKGHGFSDLWKEIEADRDTYDLFFVADAGTNDQDFIKQMGCSVITLDHHEKDMDTVVSDNNILVNNQTSPLYKNKELTGAGVALQFCRAYDIRKGEGRAFWEDYLDLAALGVDGDMGSGLVEENQWLWRNGFSRVRNSFLCALIDKQNFSMKGVINPISVAFYIVPLINAVIRAGAAEEKERLYLAFICGDELVESGRRGAFGEFVPRAEEIARQCVNIKSRQTRVLEAAETQVETKIEKNGLLENKILFIELDDEDDFPSELNGLVAMRCAAKYKRPTIIGRRNKEGMIRGSGRGLAASKLKDLREFLLSSGMFEYVSGHANAHGFSLPEKSIPAFLAYSNKKLKDVDFNESYYDVNFERYAFDDDLSLLISEIDEAADCWATMNPEPILHISNINVSKKNISIIGKNKDTIRWTTNGITYLVFSAKDRADDFFSQGELLTVEVVGKANVNVWNNQETPQILVSNFEVRPMSLEF